MRFDRVIVVWTLKGSLNNKHCEYCEQKISEHVI